MADLDIVNTASSISHIAAVRAHAQQLFESKYADFSYDSLKNEMLYSNNNGGSEFGESDGG
jgi:hypothetical protein